MAPSRYGLCPTSWIRSGGFWFWLIGVAMIRSKISRVGGKTNMCIARRSSQDSNILWYHLWWQWLRVSNVKWRDDLRWIALMPLVDSGHSCSRASISLLPSFHHWLEFHYVVRNRSRECIYMDLVWLQIVNFLSSFRSWNRDWWWDLCPKGVLLSSIPDVKAAPHYMAN